MPKRTTCTCVGVDIGGSRLSVGLVTSDGKILALRRLKTPREAGAEECVRELLEVARAMVKEAPTENPPVAVGIGFGGPVDPTTGTVRRSHHIEGWSDVPLAKLFSEATGLEVHVENDANAAALGEALFGAGYGCEVLLYVNVGTGIGGGIVIRGRVYRGAHFNAGEIGHLVLLPDGPVCPCGKRGCLEALASGDALGRRARELHDAARLVRSALAGAENLTGRMVGEYASRGDEVARTIVAEAGGYLGWTLALAANLIDPDVIVVGGGVADLGDLYLGPARSRYRELAMEYVSDVSIVPATLGYDAGVIGAAAVALTASASEEIPR